MNTPRIPWIAIAFPALAACPGPAAESTTTTPGAPGADSGADGVHLKNPAGWMISGNHLYGDKADGIDATRLQGATISGNYIEDFGTASRSGS